MSSLFVLKSSTLAVLLVVSFASTLCQANHAFSTYEYQGRDRHGAFEIVYEVIVAVLLVVGMLFVHACYECLDGFFLRIWCWNLPLVPLLWLNVIGAAIAVFSAIYLRHPLFAGDACAFLCLFPPVMEAVSPIVPLCLYTAWFFARAIYVARWDIRARSLRQGRHLVNEALKGLPEGIILAQSNGRVLLVNDTMRRLLSSLGRPLRLSDANGFWSALTKISTPTSDGGLCVKNEQGRTMLFYRLDETIDQQAYRQYWAFDVTESIELSVEIEQANDQLAKTADQMEEQLCNVREIARREALLAMQARMHDVASQRLSILHGMIQLGKTDDASLKELKPLLTSIIEDLSDERSMLAESDGFDADDASIAAEVSGIEPLQHAFSLMGTRIELMGDLPDDNSVRAAFVQVIREAATNAVHHARATEVHVALTNYGLGGYWSMEITNDGKPAERLQEGNGIRGMRRRIERLAGTVSVTCLSPFTLVVEVPRGGACAVEDFSQRSSEIECIGEGRA